MFFIKKLQKKNARNEQLFNKCFKINLKSHHLILFYFEEFRKAVSSYGLSYVVIIQYVVCYAQSENYDIFVYICDNIACTKTSRITLFIYIAFYYMFYLLHYRPKTSPFVAYKRMFESSWEYADGPGGGFSLKSRQCLTYIVQKICSNPNW